MIQFYFVKDKSSNDYCDDVGKSHIQKGRGRGLVVERQTPERVVGGFDPHSGRRVLFLSKIHLPPKKVLVIPRKRWLCPDITEKLLTGT